eukprot:832479-Prymnesium_polylepis.1
MTIVSGCVIWYDDREAGSEISRLALPIRVTWPGSSADWMTEFQPPISDCCERTPAISATAAAGFKGTIEPLISTVEPSPSTHESCSRSSRSTGAVVADWMAASVDAASREPRASSVPFVGRTRINGVAVIGCRESRASAGKTTVRVSGSTMSYRSDGGTTIIAELSLVRTTFVAVRLRWTTLDQDEVVDRDGTIPASSEDATASSAAEAWRPTSGAHESPMRVISSSSDSADRIAASDGLRRNEPASRARPVVGRMTSGDDITVRMPETTASGGTAAERVSGAWRS